MTTGQARKKGTSLRTAELAAAAGVHPNTVRLYERLGLLPPVPRDANGYRRFSRHHLACLMLGRTALGGDWPGRAIRRSAVALVRAAATRRPSEVLPLAQAHLALVRAERARAVSAAEALRSWPPTDASGRAELTIKKAASRLGLTADILRNWEKNGLLDVPRDPANGYRLYGEEHFRRCLVIRLLFQAGFGAIHETPRHPAQRRQPGRPLRPGRRTHRVDVGPLSCYIRK